MIQKNSVYLSLVIMNVPFGQVKFNEQTDDETDFSYDSIGLHGVLWHPCATDIGGGRDAAVACFP